MEESPGQKKNKSNVVKNIKYISIKILCIKNKNV